MPIITFSGVVIRNLPPEMSDKDIESFIHSKGVPKGHKAIKISVGRKNKNVDIDDLDVKICETLITDLHEKIFFNRKIYCRGLSNIITPEKGPQVDNRGMRELPSNTSAGQSEFQVIPEKTPLSIPGLPKIDSSRAAKKERQRQNKLRKQKSLNDVGPTKSIETSDDSFTSVDENIDETSQFEFKDMIVVTAAKPCSNLDSLLPRSPKKPTKRRNSTEDDILDILVEFCKLIVHRR